jgi:hypothetical protein
MKMGRAPAFTTALDLRPGKLVKNKYSDNYYIVNKVTENGVALDNGYLIWQHDLVQDDYCNKHNNPPTREEVKMSKQQATKNDQGKAPISLIPSDYILGTASVFAFGGRKYGLNNFRNGIAHSRCLDAAFRHLLAISRGEELDPESGLPHIYHASCSIAMLDYMRLKHPALNDIYELTTKQEEDRQLCFKMEPPTGETKKLEDLGIWPSDSKLVLK